jgi:hypothetical protein
MKRITSITAALILALNVSAQINFNNNTVSNENYSSALGENNISTGLSSFAAGKNDTVTGNYSFGLGYRAHATGEASFAAGVLSKSSGIRSMSFGHYIHAAATSSFVIGLGGSATGYLTNNNPNSLMIGFGSSKPTLYVGEATGLDETGKIGIGDVTDPQAKLHIKLDYGEFVALRLEPWSWQFDNYAELQFGNEECSIKGIHGIGFNFYTPYKFVFHSGNVGIGTGTPTEKLEVAGKIKTTGFQLSDGTQGENKYLKSDADGNASWATSNVNCLDCLASGDYASAIGKYDTATGDMSFAGGYNNKANGILSFVFGAHSIVDGTYSVAIGHSIESNGLQSMVIGTGASASNKLTNNISKSLMIGFGSEKPTLFVGPTGPGYTGKIGIGDVTNPQAKLHIKGDQNEQASLFIEPFTFGGEYDAELWMATQDYGLRAAYGKMYFNTGGNYIFNSPDANVGIGNLNPLAKLQVSGDLFIDDSNSGMILKSPDGQCWKITVGNDGELTTTAINCDLTTQIQKPPQPGGHSIHIYPNPAHDNVSIENPFSITLFASIRDIDGALLSTQKIEPGNNIISLAGLAAGYYLISITDNTNKVITSDKLIKQQ